MVLHALGWASQASLAWRVFWFMARCLWNVLNWKQAWLLEFRSFLTFFKESIQWGCWGNVDVKPKQKPNSPDGLGDFSREADVFQTSDYLKSNMCMSKSEPDMLTYQASSVELHVKITEEYWPIWQTVEFRKGKVKICQIQQKNKLHFLKGLNDLDFI